MLTAKSSAMRSPALHYGLVRLSAAQNPQCDPKQFLLGRLCLYVYFARAKINCRCASEGWG